MKNNSIWKKHRKRLFIVPLLAAALFLLTTWIMQTIPGRTSTTSAQQELNMKLPEPGSIPDTWDKLSLYDQAQRESAKYKEAQESDPYFDLITFQKKKEAPIDSVSSQLMDDFPGRQQRVDPNESRVNQKLKTLYQELNKAEPTSQHEPPAWTEVQPAESSFTNDVNRLEEMMKLMQETNQEDPEMEEMENVLEKILDIQHPERVQSRMTETNHVAEPSFSLQRVHKNESISSLTDSLDHQITRQPGFYSLEQPTNIIPEGNTLEAVIHDTQQLSPGSLVRIRLIKPTTILNYQLAPGQFLYGTCTLNGDRLSISISSIRINNVLLPVDLTGYDLDGMEGIYVPGVILPEVAGQSTDKAIQGTQFGALENSLPGQVATAGIETAKNLFSKKVKQLKITIHAGYHILLKDKNIKYI